VDKSNVEDVFRLSEPQEALLLHSVQQRGGSAVLQLRASLLGPLDVDLFRRAWDETVSRHPMLRCSVHWQGLKHPVHVIARRAALAVEYLDWRDLPAPARLARLDRLVDDDRRRGLDVTAAPVMRVTIVHETDSRYELLWTCHHVLFDGWSGALVLNEMLEWYQAFRDGRGPELPSPGSFHEYVAWTRAQDTAAADDFWRARLTSAAPSCLGNGGPTNLRSEVPPRATAAVKIDSGLVEKWARTHSMTVSTVMLGCWALLLHLRTGIERPVFGVTLSGRSSDIERFGSVVGMFANTVPLQLRVEPGLALSRWFRRVLEHQQDVQQFEHVSLGRILHWAGITSRPPFFDSLVVQANYPHGELGRAEQPPAEGEAERIRLVDFRGAVTSAFPVTLVVKPGRELSIELLFDTARLPPADAERILNEFRNIVETVLSPRPVAVSDVLTAIQTDRLPPAVRAAPPQLPRTTPETAADPGEAAADAIEAQMMRIFDDLIDVREIGREDNFFELGGDSLLLPRLIDRIEGDFGITLPLGVIFEAPTVRGLAAAVQSRNATPSWRSLVGIRERGSRPPVYLVHGLGGEIGYFYNLPQYLHPEQPVYGLQAAADAYTAMEPMAAHYVREIRARQPTGPYLLGGYCLGGLVAFEMARQLVEAGESVPLLMIIDSAVPGTRRRTPSIASRMRRLASGTPAEVLGNVKRGFDRAGALLKSERKVPSDPDVIRWENVPRAFHAIATRLVNALRGYAPRPLDQDVWLFRCDDSRFAPDLGWGPLVRGRLTIVMIPGDHSNVLKEPYLPHAARQIAAALETVAIGNGARG
jgi:thioesterase domain-containing protein/acyl carrier protein